MDHFSYFMLRVRRTGEPGSATEVTGTLQQLSTGEKRVFGDPAELVDLLLSWSESNGSKLGPGSGEGNALVPAAGVVSDLPGPTSTSARAAGPDPDARRTR